MNTRRCLLGSITLCVIAAISGCSSSSNSNNQNPPPPPPVSIAVSPQTAAIGTGNSTSLQVTLQNDTADTWTVNGVANGDASVGTITTDGVNGTYTAPAGTVGLVATITATSVADTTKSATATVYVVPPGTITPTANTLVATYTITPPTDAKLTVQFGPDTTYGRITSNQPTPQGGGTVSTFVAGMRASTPYHMQGIVEFTDGTQFFDADQVFTTGALPAGQQSTITATTTSGMTPQPGIELLNLLNTGGAALATDLQGNIIWYYPTNSGTTAFVQPLRMLSNGHMLLTIAPNSAVPQPDRRPRRKPLTKSAKSISPAIPSSP